MPPIVNLGVDSRCATCVYTGMAEEEKTLAQKPADHDWVDDLRALSACNEAIDYAKEFATAQEAWDACERGDWMLWWYGRVAGPPGHDSRRPLVLAACECARLALHLVPEGEERPLVAIQTAEAWARGRDGAPSLDEVRSASAAADADASAAYARAETLKTCADIVRKHYPRPPATKGANR